MPTDFKPLRRKLGVVTLVLACVFAGAWIRGLAGELWIYHQFGDKVQYRMGTIGKGITIEKLERHIDEVFGSQILFQSTVARIPHICVVIPLTLLSAWLLLSKTRKPRLPTEKTSACGEREIPSR